MDDKTIKTPLGDEIKWLPKDKNNYLDKSTLIFGGTGSGKTTIIEEILFLLKDDIPNFIVVANENSMKAYKNKLDRRCILNDLTKEKLLRIWNRQKSLTQCYEIANDINILESLFHKIEDKEIIIIIDALKTRTNQYINMIDSNKEYTFAQKKTNTNALLELQFKKIKEYYKNSIRNNILKLKEMKLTLNEMTALEYIDLNPRLMIILDDVSDKFKGWMKLFKKGETNPFESIFYQGRHNFITFLFAAHDDTVVEPQLRKNSRITIYTNSQSLITSFGRAGNGYSIQERKFADRIATYIFGDEAAGIKTHQKLCYVREDSKPFRYTIANIYPDFTLGCIHLNELINAMPKRNDNLKDNPFIKSLTEKNKKAF
jgi:energy-coupling factor transporter ATP-binding protein EcfA2